MAAVPPPSHLESRTPKFVRVEYPPIEDMMKHRIKTSSARRYFVVAVVSPPDLDKALPSTDAKDEEPGSAADTNKCPVPKTYDEMQPNHCVMFLGAYSSAKEAEKFAMKMQKGGLYYADMHVIDGCGGWHLWPPSRMGQNVRTLNTQDELEHIFKRQVDRLDKEEQKLLTRIANDGAGQEERQQARRERFAAQNAAEREAELKQNTLVATSDEADNSHRETIGVVTDSEDNDNQKSEQQTEDAAVDNGDDEKQITPKEMDALRSKMRALRTAMQKQRKPKSSKTNAPASIVSESGDAVEKTALVHGTMHETVDENGVKYVNGQRVVSTDSAPCVVTVGTARTTPPESMTQ